MIHISHVENDEKKNLLEPVFHFSQSQKIVLNSILKIAQCMSVTLSNIVYLAFSGILISHFPKFHSISLFFFGVPFFSCLSNNHHHHNHYHSKKQNKLNTSSKSERRTGEPERIGLKRQIQHCVQLADKMNDEHGCTHQS